jgi:hypothetical protein
MSKFEGFDFVAKREKVDRGPFYDVWKVEPTGDFETDHLIGSVFARQILENDVDAGTPALFSSVVKEMARKGTFGGIEIGFLQTVAMRAVGIEA